jgi:hypothetical protein
MIVLEGSAQEILRKFFAAMNELNGDLKEQFNLEEIARTNTLKAFGLSG